MFGRIHQLLPALVGFLGVATAWADTGYLPQTGPMPLRFRVPPPPVAEHVRAPVAPPPSAPIALPPPPMPPAPPVASNAAPANIVMPVVPTNGPALEFEAREPVIGPGPAAAPDGVISPQMLIKYFTTPAILGTNAAGMGVVAPVGFTPPPVTTPVTTPAPTPPALIKPPSPTKP